MTRAKWYSPQLSREIVARLYHKAQDQGVPMTVLANQIIERSLDADKSSEMPAPPPNKNTNDCGSK